MSRKCKTYSYKKSTASFVKRFRHPRVYYKTYESKQFPTFIDLHFTDSEYDRLTGGIILQLTYGIDVREEGNDPFVDLIEKANTNFNASTIPGAFPVDFFPILKCLPEWLPGMGFMETARTWLKDTIAMVDVPYNYTKDQMVSFFFPRSFIVVFTRSQAKGNAPPSFVSTVLENEEHMTPEEIRDLKYTASSMYGGTYIHQFRTIVVVTKFCPAFQAVPTRQSLPNTHSSWLWS